MYVLFGRLEYRYLRLTTVFIARPCWVSPACAGRNVVFRQRILLGAWRLNDKKR